MGTYSISYFMVTLDIIPEYTQKAKNRTFLLVIWIAFKPIEYSYMQNIKTSILSIVISCKI